MEENRLYQSPDERFSLCIWVRQRLPDYQEGLLDAMTVEAVRAHLSVCYLCMKEYSELEQTVRLVETLPFVEPEKDHAPAIMAALRAQPGHSFRSPVVEVEAAALNALLSEPRSTTGRQRRLATNGEGRGREGASAGVWAGERVVSRHAGVARKPVQSHSFEMLQEKERRAVGAVLAVLLALLAASSWGRAAVGVLASGMAARCHQAAVWIEAAGFGGSLAGWIAGPFRLASQGADRLFGSWQGLEPGVLLAWLTVTGAACALFARRRLRAGTI